MKFFLAFGVVSAGIGASLPPLDWMNYVAIALVAVNAFLLGTEVERDSTQTAGHAGGVDGT